MSCESGGLRIKRHNEIRDLVGSLAKEVNGWSYVGKEPTIKEATYSESGQEHSFKPALRADLVIRGLFGEAHKDAFIDFRVHDADASSALPNIRASLNRQEAK